jgi:hypothetical protein
VVAASGDSAGHVDATFDARWRALRVDVIDGAWRVRAGVAGNVVGWRRDPDGGMGETEAVGLAGRSPSLLVATARLLALGQGERRRVRLLSLTEPVLAPLVIEQGWTLTGVETHPAGDDELPVERYEVADLATGERRVVHLAGDVVVHADGVELESLEDPPTLAT